LLNGIFQPILEHSMFTYHMIYFYAFNHFKMKMSVDFKHFCLAVYIYKNSQVF